MGPFSNGKLQPLEVSPERPEASKSETSWQRSRDWESVVWGRQPRRREYGVADRVATVRRGICPCDAKPKHSRSRSAPHGSSRWSKTQ